MQELCNPQYNYAATWCWVLTPSLTQLRMMLIFSELFLDKEEGEAVHDVELGDDEVEGVAG